MRKVDANLLFHVRTISERAESFSTARSYKPSFVRGVHPLLDLREMCDGSFGMFHGHVSMTGLAMLNRLFQVGHRFCHMRVYASSYSMLERGFGMGHKLLGMTLLAVFRCFRGVVDGIFDVLLLLPHDITSCPTFTEG